MLVRVEHPQGAWAARHVRARAREFLPALPRSGELSVLIATDRAVQALNRKWRRIDRPTDVLSFEQDAASGLLGDVVLSLDTARRQAAELGHPLGDELSRLLAHGLLHLVGHDHHEPRAAAKMARAEEALLGKAGMVGAARARAAAAVTKAPVPNARGSRAPRAPRSKPRAGGRAHGR